MRIGIDCRLWNETGVGRYTRNLVYNLAKIDHKNQYTLFFRKKEFDEVELPGNNFEKRLADIRWHSIAEQTKLPGLLSKELLDLVHFPYFSIPIFYNRPFVVTIHDLILHHFPTGEASTLSLLLYKIKLQGYRLVIAQAVKKARKIITVSQATKQEIVDHLKVPKEKIVVTYEGIDEKLKVKNLASWRSGQNSKVQVKSQNYFLYVGNAYPHKNLERLLEAFKIVLTTNRDIQLILVGKEDYFYERLLMRIKEKGLEKSVILKGHITDEELAGLYKNARAVIIPSLMEGFSLPILEAMANDCLVLASDIPVHREIGKGAITYFDPNNREEIVEKMKEVCSNDSNHRIEFIKKGLERVKEFSWEKMAKETLKVYESSSSASSE